MSFPSHRPRRLRQTEPPRRLVHETRLDPQDFVYPLFVVEGERVRRPIASMPGVSQLSVDQAVEEVALAKSLGVSAVILFGVPDHKDARGSSGYASDGIVQRALSTIKSAVAGVQLIADVCLCEYTDHG